MGLADSRRDENREARQQRKGARDCGPGVVWHLAGAGSGAGRLSVMGLSEDPSVSPWEDESSAPRAASSGALVGGSGFGRTVEGRECRSCRARLVMEVIGARWSKLAIWLLDVSRSLGSHPQNEAKVPAVVVAVGRRSCGRRRTAEA